jgi:bifunctional DNA-binding transcriptional regulator/antitoxin component of YhaV-PrlF toxin-antitoxin module
VALVETTVPKEVREALDLEPSAKLRWEVRGKMRGRI